MACGTGRVEEQQAALERGLSTNRNALDQVGRFRWSTLQPMRRHKVHKVAGVWYRECEEQQAALEGGTVCQQECDGAF